LVPAVTVAVCDGDRVLLVHRTDSGLWSIPGGAIKPGETVRQAGVHRAKEKTGYDVEITGLVGVYADPRHVTAYSDGEVRTQFSVCMAARVTGGEARTSSQSSEVVWKLVDRLDELDIHPSIRLRIDHATDPNRTEPWLT
jgi:ADP-ribose pyrophosphatase YjhB (NUDIX family)